MRDHELTPQQIEAGWRATFSTENPYCPCDLKTFTKAVRWTLAALARQEEGRENVWLAEASEQDLRDVFHARPDLRLRLIAVLAPPIAGEVSAATAGGECVLVPREPTEAMLLPYLSAWQRHDYTHGNDVRRGDLLHFAASQYRDTLAAAPTPSSPVVAQGNITFDELMAQQTPEVRVAIEVERERDLLANAIRSAAVKAGIVDPDAPLTGPQLLMLCDNLATAPQASAERVDAETFMARFNCEAEGNTNTRLYACDTENVRNALSALTAKPAPEGGDARVVDAARAFVAKLHEVHDDLEYKAVWYCAHNHRGSYRGPKYETELAALETALAAQPVQEGR